MSTKLPPMGTISGFNSIGTDNNNPNGNPYSYSVDDLRALLLDLKRKLSPERIERLELLITKHLDDENNPHRLTLDDLVTSVMLELYKTWQAENVNNTGSFEDFKKILFQDIRIADMDTHLQGTSPTEVTSVLGVATLINNHDLDPNAHANMFRKMFPGRNIHVPPSFCMSALVGSHSLIPTTRNSPCSYVDADGYIKTVANNVLPIDYSLGDAMFSIWDTRTNKVKFSEAFTNTYWNKKSCTLYANPTVKKPDGTLGAIKVTEVTTDHPVEHAIVTSEQFAVVAGNVYTVSFAAMYDGGRQFVGLELDDAVAGEYNGVRFDMVNEQFYLHAGHPSNTHAYEPIVKLANGWFIITYSFKAIASGNTSIKLFGSDLLDGDGNHNGDDTKGLYLDLVQFEEGLGRSPYIKTVGSEVTRDKTVIKIDTSSWYNTDEGTLCVTVSIPQDIQQTRNHTVAILGNGPSAICLSMAFPLTHKRRLFSTVYKQDNSVIKTNWSSTNVADDKFNSFTISFKNNNLIFGDSGVLPVNQEIEGNLNTNAQYLYVGCDRNSDYLLNGYIKSIIYYPIYTDIEQTEFLVNGVG